MAKLPDHEEKYIRQYVESQTRDDSNPVKLIQKIGSRRAGGQSHEIYDVWMDKGDRWWVITNITNLYSQADFNSIDQAFTFHLGICLQLNERSRSDASDEGGGAVSSAWRKFARAADAMNGASEAEDFQAVAIRCREALLAMIRDHTDDEWVPTESDRPEVANFKAWIEIFSVALATGRLRSYLKLLGEKSWDLTVWLQHYVNATEWDAELVLNSTAHLINTLDLAIIRLDNGEPQRCPQCDSYRVESDGDITEREGQKGWWSQDVCAACGWRGEEDFDPWTVEHQAAIAAYINDDKGDEREE